MVNWKFLSLTKFERWLEVSNKRAFLGAVATWGKYYSFDIENCYTILHRIMFTETISTVGLLFFQFILYMEVKVKPQINVTQCDVFKQTKQIRNRRRYYTDEKCSISYWESRTVSVIIESLDTVKVISWIQELYKIAQYLLITNFLRYTSFYIWLGTLIGYFVCMRKYNITVCETRSHSWEAESVFHWTTSVMVRQIQLPW